MIHFEKFQEDPNKVPPRIERSYKFSQYRFNKPQYQVPSLI